MDEVHRLERTLANCQDEVIRRREENSQLRQERDALREALVVAQEIITVLCKDHDFGEHDGSPGEWVYEGCSQIDTILARTEKP